MKTFWFMIFLLAAFGIVGRIDYECAQLDLSPVRVEYVSQFDRPLK